jgi:hypothetical protein
MNPGPPEHKAGCYMKRTWKEITRKIIQDSLRPCHYSNHVLSEYKTEPVETQRHTDFNTDIACIVLIMKQITRDELIMQASCNAC